MLLNITIPQRAILDDALALERAGRLLGRQRAIHSLRALERRELLIHVGGDKPGYMLTPRGRYEARWERGAWSPICESDQRRGGMIRLDFDGRPVEIIASEPVEAELVLERTIGFKVRTGPRSEAMERWKNEPRGGYIRSCEVLAAPTKPGTIPPPPAMRVLWLEAGLHDIRWIVEAGRGMAPPFKDPERIRDRALAILEGRTWQQ